MRTTIVTVTAEYNFFTIGAEHGKSIKTIVAAYFLQVGSVFVNRIQIKREAAFIFLVRSKYDPFAVG